MKILAKLSLMALCMAAAACGMTDPYEKWTEDGDPAENEDRLYPSELRDVLCAADGWKLSYDNNDFYFSFTEDGNVECNSSILKDALSTAYRFNFDSYDAVMLTIEGSGHLAYLPSNVFGETFTVTGFTSDELSLAYGSGQKTVMNAVSETDIRKLDAEKWAVRNILVAADGWKLSRSGNDFYFQFSEDGKVICNSNMPKAAATTDYGFSGTIESMVLTINGGGHMSYLENYDESFNVVSSSAGSIGLKGTQTGESFSLTKVSKADIDAVEQEKGVIFKIIEYKLANGVIRSSDGRFAAHYAIDYITGNNIRFDIIKDRVLSHETVGITIDDNANVTFESSVSVAGQNISGISFDLSSKTATLQGASGLSAGKNTDAVSYFIKQNENNNGGYQTHLIKAGENVGGANDELWNELKAGASEWHQIEVSDRGNRPIVFCPANGNNDKWYTGFYGTNDVVSSVSEDVYDLIYFTSLRGDMLGLGGNPKNIEVVQNMFPKFLAAFSHADGLIIADENADGAHYMYFISPTTQTWFKARR